MELKNAKTKTGIFSSLITLLVVGLLIFAGPAQAFSIDLGDFDNEAPVQGTVISVDAVVEMSSNELSSMPPINITLNNNLVCVFDAYSGDNIEGCVLSGITIVANHDSVNESTYLGYGYGYSVETTTTFGYTISINTSRLNLTETQDYAMKLITVLGNSAVSSFSVGVTLEGELFEEVGFLLPDGESNPESIPNVTTNNDWVINDSNMSVLLPEGTTISATDGSNLNVSAITSALTEITDLSGLAGAAGALQFGIPGFGLTFSQPITIKIFVGHDLNGSTFSAYRALSTTGPWEIITTCLVGEFESGVCQFNTTKASYFVAAESTSTTSTSTTSASGTGGYCSTEWIISEWSECGDGVQTRTVSYPANFCAPKTERPIETRSCTSDEDKSGKDTENQDRGFFSLLTGFVIGDILSSPVNTAIVIVILLVLVGLVMFVIAKRKAAKKSSKTKKK